MSDEFRGRSLPCDFSPIPDATWPPALAALRGGFATKLNVYRTMAHHPALLIAWSNLRDHLVLDNALSADLLEIVILRTAYRRASAYEWAHHVVRGQKAGLDEKRIAAAALPPDQAVLPIDALLMCCVDALVDTNRLSEDLLEALLLQVGKPAVLDLIATVGMYSLLAYMVETFNTPLDEDVATALDIAVATSRIFKPDFSA